GVDAGAARPLSRRSASDGARHADGSAGAIEVTASAAGRDRLSAPAQWRRGQGLPEVSASYLLALRVTTWPSDWMMRPEPMMLLETCFGSVSNVSFPDPIIVTSTLSCGAASTSPLPVIVTVSSFIGSWARLARPDPAIVMSAVSLLPFPSMRPLPAMVRFK